MLTLRMARRARRGLAAETRVSIVHAVLALAFAVVIVAIAMHTPGDMAESALGIVAGP